MDLALASALRAASRAADAALAAVADALPPGGGARGCIDGVRAALPAAGLPGGLARGDEVDVGGVRVVVDRLLGEGGFSYVYAVTDPVTSAPLALKRVLVGDADGAAAARAEAALAARHGGARGLLPLVASGEADASPGVVAVCMLSPLCAGGSLADAAPAPAPPPRPLAASLAALADAAAGLAALHAAGVAHFDVKPHNVLVDGGGRGWLTDFGSARSPLPLPLPDRAAAAALTEWAASHCTAAYRAPELYEPGEAGAGRVGAPADVWGLGCCLYALAAARGHGGAVVSPFERAGAAGSMALAVAAGRVAWPEGARARVPDRVRALVARCLAADPGARPGAAEVAAELEALAGEVGRVVD